MKALDVSLEYKIHCDRWEIHTGRKRSLVRPSRRWLHENQH